MPDGSKTGRPRLLIEEWLPAAAVGVECIRERSTGQQPPDKRFHVWWARRPLAASRAAVLASVLPADFPRDMFERLMGFGRPGDEIVAIRELMNTGVKVEGGFGAPRAFKGAIRAKDIDAAHEAASRIWGHLPTIMDPMAGGGSIPLESARLGFPTLANEYNPVACSVLEATLDYPFRFGPKLADRARHWGREWDKRVAARLGRFFPKETGASVQAYIFARTIPCPTTGYMTPLVPDWHLLKPKVGIPVVAKPIVDKAAGTWTTEIRMVGAGPGALAAPPPRSYAKGKGVSLFTGESISPEWIKAKAQAGQMGNALYAVALKTPLISLANDSIDAVVVDPPYADNVQYSELADFFYVWLKRSQGHRRFEWFSSTLCENEEEAVKNDARFRAGAKKAKDAAEAAQAYYQGMMTKVFAEAHRVLRTDGVLTVMFTHKKQEAWEALFASLIEAGFTITATWPVKTESEHSLHQAKKNAAQSTVVLVSRLRAAHAGTGYFDAAMQGRIRDAAEAAAERLAKEGLNPIDQLVGSFGPAMEVFSAYDRVRTDTGEPVNVGAAIDIAADAVAGWRIRQLAQGGLQGVDGEAQFALLCWATLRAAEFRFNEAKLLGHAVGMDVSRLQQAGLISMKADKVNILSASDRRRDAPLTEAEANQLSLGWEPGSGRRIKQIEALKIHPRDTFFRTPLDRAQALALAYADAGGGGGGIGAARSFVTRNGIKAGDPTVRLIEALLRAAPPAVRKDTGAIAEKFAEFRAWHALLNPVLGLTPPDWTVKKPDQAILNLLSSSSVADPKESEDADLEDEGEEEEGLDDEEVE